MEQSLRAPMAAPSLTGPIPAGVTSAPHPRPRSAPDLGQLILKVGPMAHGGHCVARHEGRPVFVRHAIPGETVVAELTAADPSGQFWRADTVKVIRASEFRRLNQWKLADSLRSYPAGRQPVGGAEYGHIVLDYQRRLKAQVFRDTMVRLGRQTVEDVEVLVHGMHADEPAGLHWRTRTTFAVSPGGRLSIPVHSGQDTIPVSNIPLAVQELNELHLWEIDFSGAASVNVTTPGHGREALIIITPVLEISDSPETLKSYANVWRGRLSKLSKQVSAMVAVRRSTRTIQKTQSQTSSSGTVENLQLRGRSWVQEDVSSERYGTKAFRVTGEGYWPVHRDAAATLVEAVMQAADAQDGQVVADLYSGAGLFSAFLADAVGQHGAVLSVEADPSAIRDARLNLQDVPQATVLEGKADEVLSRWLDAPVTGFSQGGLQSRRVDTVVMHPPRSGAGRAVLSRVHELSPGKIVYVSSETAAFAQDTRWLNEHGWSLDAVQVYDLAPDTHRMTSVGLFTRPGAGSA
ncbi:tRNA/tmRNA/rRNA uracil-C5-methylase (TrmA/RlmC/RlmD family) [Citricoccus muralis]|uniref:tRNA/tmRNA/rRNA uracil-C5-methylase (TrmA/RlmC/RlmD family) n=2 Tax=Citricoccus muralis TaxID=169134 RepID=A0A3D9LBJ2_9MICC|nr:tRNA/tmRNA/rRNA uracil-C5-methylase (TrmA/RlmC/RlmD family) [Citricoccus muralis]